MSNDIALHDRPPAGIAPALATLGARLRKVRPSSNLDKSIDVLIEHVFAREESPDRQSWTRYVIAAGMTALAVLGLAIVGMAAWVTFAGDGEKVASHTPPENSPADSQELLLDATHAGEHDLGLVVADGAHSLWPTQAAVFRVRTSFDSAVLPGDATSNERQFWVDVRVANDGTMRIVRIVPAEDMPGD